MQAALAALGRAGLVDELVLFNAGLAIGAEGAPMLGALGLERLAQAPRYQLHAHESVGEDIMQVWQRQGAKT